MACQLTPGPEPKPEFKKDGRTYRLWLDTNQYQQDMAGTVHGSEVCDYSDERTLNHKYNLWYGKKVDVDSIA